ncbi:MAG: 30S ribosomal protein S12 methylthiotransferase RimO [Thermomicrobiales bacterium]|nr:30S ribosomal protein S12 methylthiotransferase RimO [Thermomicrobiales bacterium]
MTTVTRTRDAGRSFSVVTLGCAKNRVDSEGMSTLLLERGYDEREEPSDADVVIVNTCGFLGAARTESIETLQGFVDQRNPGQYIVAAGCLPALRDYSLDLPAGVDKVLTTREWFRIGDTVGSLFGEAPQPQLAGCDGLTTTFTHHHAGPSAYVKIADGCDHACAFCTIPTIKGRQASKRPLHVVQEIVDLVALGSKEIVLVSQDTIRYGADLGMKNGVADLIDMIGEQVPNLPWLRLLYIYPNPIVLKMIDALARHDMCVNYIDMPLQHAHPAVLKRMLRPSNLELTKRILDHARNTLDDVVLRTTLITGFPGETDEEFETLMEFIDEQEFDHVGVFTYSPEPGTVAFDMADPVPAEVAEERRNAIMELQQSISLEHNQKLEGRTLKVLVESIGEVEDENGQVSPVSVGRAYRHAPEVDGLVFIDGEQPVGEFVDATVYAGTEYDLWARVDAVIA